VSDNALRALEHVHGHLGWLSAAALVHPAILLRRAERRAPLAALLATALVTTSGAMGAWVYPDYRRLLKQQIFIHAPRIGWMFERKEHLAVGAVVLAWAGLASHWAAIGASDAALREPLARGAHLAYVGSAGLAIATGVIGVIVATYSTF
jgi:hypothetical protein